jgi:hypothetical protein
MIGCAELRSKLEVVAHKDAAAPRFYHQKFTEGWFTGDENSGYDIVLLTSKPSQAFPSQLVRQLVHIRLIWRSTPGLTWSHETSLNAVVLYYVVHGNEGICYEGAGYVEVTPSRSRGRIKGEFGSIRLEPGRSYGDPPDIFGAIELLGKFRARRNDSKTQELLREALRDFGMLNRQE